MENLFIKLIRHYTYDMRLKTRLVIPHIILVLLPTVVLSGPLCLYIYGIVMDNSIRSEQALPTQTVTFIESLIPHVRCASDTITDSMMAQNLFQAPRSEANTRDVSTSEANSLFHLMQSITDHSMIMDVKIYYDDSMYGDLVQYNKIGDAPFNPVFSVSNSYWYDIPSTSQQSRLLRSKLYLTPDEAGRSGKLAYIARVPYTYEGGTMSGIENASAYMVPYLSGPAFETVLCNDVMVTDEAAFLVNEQDVIVSTSDMGLAGKYFIPRRDLEQRVGKKKALSLASYLGGSVYAAYFPTADTDWYMMLIIPTLHIGDAGKMLMTHLAMIYLLFAILTPYTIFRLSGPTADRIIDVALQMKTVCTGPPQPMDVVDTGRDEIDVLSGTYNYITEEIITLVDSQEKASDELRMAEFHALQVRTNSHSLCNTLDIISRLSQTGQGEKVTETAQILSRFYKLTLNRRELTNSIEKEPKHASLYARLQNMRYGNYMASVMDVPEGLCEYTIPELTFQPIMKNVFPHGIMMKEEKKGDILLTGWPEGDGIIFIIFDDGAGIPSEALDTLEDDVDAGIGSSASPRHIAFSGHIGIYNTNLGLKGLYGEPCGLSITSILGRGTETIVWVPARHIMSD